MKVTLNAGQLGLEPLQEDDQILLNLWTQDHEDQVFEIIKTEEHGWLLVSLGPKADACRIPINIGNMADPPFNLISNFAHTPFELDGLQYASVEGFWQGLKFEKASDRRSLAQMWGGPAKKATKGIEQPACFEYQKKLVRAGTHEHHALMYEANLAKFTQNESAKNALLATHYRPILHKMRRDSLTIPGAVMGDIWMRVREYLRNSL